MVCAGHNACLNIGRLVIVAFTDFKVVAKLKLDLKSTVLVARNEIGMIDSTANTFLEIDTSSTKISCQGKTTESKVRALCTVQLSNTRYTRQLHQ